MAQYGDPQNPDLSQFQRYTPGTESSPQGQPGNGYAGFMNRAMGSQPGGSNRYPDNGSAHPSIPPVRGEGYGAVSPQTSQGAGAYDTDWSQRLSGNARKRNQWRQFQTLKPDFGNPDPAPEPASPNLPPRNASLPVIKSPPQPAQRQPQSRYPVAPPGVRAQPLGYGAPPSNFSQAEHGSPVASSQRQRSSIEMPPQPFKTSSNLRRTPPLLQPHPHSTSPSNATGANSPGAMSSTGELPSKVTPLRPGVKRSSPPQRTNSMVAQAAAEGAANLGQPSHARSQQTTKPRRRFGKPPMVVLYLIRLVILGVGVAAIAGTLLSVLSPSNLASDPGREKASQETTNLSATGPLVAGTTAKLVSDVALSQELTRLKAEIEQLATLTPGLEQSAFLVDLDTGDYVDIAGGQAISAASTVKVPVLVAFLQQVDAGQIALNQGLVMGEEQMAGGSGTMQNDPVGTRYTALEVVTQMIVNSDNTATNMMIDALGGVDALNQQFQSWGLDSTLLRNPLPDLDGTNTTSTKDLALLMALIDQGGLLMPRSRDRMFSIMQRTANRSLIPFGINDDSILANKTGDISTVLGDVALVDSPNGKRYVLSTLVNRPDNDGRASELIRRTAELAHSELSQPVAPVGGIDPSVPEEAVPAPASPEENATPPTQSPTEDNLNRETVPQG